MQDRSQPIGHRRSCGGRHDDAGTEDPVEAGFDLRDGKVVRRPYRMSVSEKLRQRHSKRVKVARRVVRGI